ncbi:hypothetical protein [Caulobacter sp. BK020]|uniref:hypothetical protein n=1 Tax=Caulobacter sp. BK020 TaxID=2512117 RepID=UPI00104F22EA|nr:hypothetical protein [Caulobacter sp. BK020]TCS14557.1 hypothetical protein EV278_107206 [Caulobacter sp. BK020]
MSPPANNRLAEIARELDLDEVELQQLREAAAGDPQAGEPRYIGQEVVEPGAWREGGHFDRVTGLPEGCPVAPLGKAGDVVYLLDTLGEVSTLKASSSGKGPIGYLFAGRSAFLEWAWPRFGKAAKGGKRPVVGWEADDARQAIVDACAWKGVFDDVDRVRGRGAWLHSDGSLIYHAGSRVLFQGKWQHPGELGDWVFPARTPIMSPQPAAADPGQVESLMMLLETWNWTRGELDARLLFGWIAAAMIGGALDWRPMVFLTGDAGTGKSTLQKLMAAVIGRGLVSSVNTTGPALYQRLKHDVVPVSVDELESEADTRAADVVIKLVRTAASGGKISRGSSEGVAREYECRSAFVLSAINHPPLGGQDEQRLAILALRPIEKAAVDGLFEGLEPHKVGAALLRRMIDGWPRWARTLKAYRKALIEVGGHTGRSADQFGPMIAAWHIALHDADPDPGMLDYWVKALDVSILAEANGQAPNWRQCLNHLVDVQPDALRTYAHKNLGPYIQGFRDQNHLDDLEKRANDVGLAISFAKGAADTWENARLFIPSTHPEVSRLFSGTQWGGRPGAGGVWASAMLQAPKDVAWAGVCGRGLDRERKGVLVRLSAVFGPSSASSSP